MDAKEIISIVNRGGGPVISEAEQAFEIYREAGSARKIVHLRGEDDTFNFICDLAAVYVAGQIKGKREERARRKKAAGAK